MVVIEDLDSKFTPVEQALEGLKRDPKFQHHIHKDPTVKRALNHWTGVHRLPAGSEEMEAWMHNERVVYVLKMVQELQKRCKLAGIGVPYNEMLSGKTELPASVKGTPSSDVERTPEREVEAPTETTVESVPSSKRGAKEPANGTEAVSDASDGVNDVSIVENERESDLDEFAPWKVQLTRALMEGLVMGVLAAVVFICLHMIQQQQLVVSDAGLEDGKLEFDKETASHQEL